MSEPRLVPELTVTDIDESLAFYVGRLGFTLRNTRPEEGFAMVEREGARIMLDRHGPGSWDTGPLERPFGRGIKLEIEVSDVDGLRARIPGPVFRETAEATNRTEAGPIRVREFCVQDPDGYLLRFQQVADDG